MEAKELLLKYINGNLNEAERLELFNHYDKEELERIVNLGNNLTLETAPVDVEWQKLKDRLVKPPQKAGSSIAKLLIMTGLLAVSVALGAYFLSSSTSDKVIENDTTQPMQIAMDDGSVIDLAPGSSFSYDEDSFMDDRKIKLQGHAYFSVTKKGNFTVKTDDVEVAVLGTTFDVWTVTDELTHVECYSGVVNVMASGKSEILKKGNHVRVESGSMYKKIADVPQSPPWLGEKLVFDKVPLSAVYAEVESYYKVIFNAQKDETKFSGTLPTNDLSKTLNVLSGVTGLTYTAEKNKIEVTAQ